MIYFGFLIFFPGPPPLQYELPLKVVNSPVKQGEAVELSVTRCASDDVFAEVTIQLIGPEIRILEDIKYFVAKGCISTISKNNIIPENLTPGEYHLVIVIEERVGTTGRYDDKIESEPFQVVENPALKK